MDHITTKQVISFILKMLHPFKWQVILMCFIPLFWAIDHSLTPYMIKIIVDRIAVAPAENVFEHLTTPAALYVLILFFMVCIQRLYTYLVDISLIPNLHKKINDSSFEVLLGKSHHYYQNNFSGSLGNKVNNLVDNIPDMLAIIIEMFLHHFLSLSIAIYILWTVNANLGRTIYNFISCFFKKISAPFNHFLRVWVSNYR